MIGRAQAARRRFSRSDRLARSRTCGRYGAVYEFRVENRGAEPVMRASGSRARRRCHGACSIVRLTVVMEAPAATVTFVLRAPEQVEELAQRLR